MRRIGDRGVTGDKMTGKQMCEVIAEEFSLTLGRKITPEEVWNCSPTGELFMIYEWYQKALELRAARSGDTGGGRLGPLT